MDRPMMPGLMLSRAMTANKAADDTMQFPTNSRRIASHLENQRFIDTIRKKQILLEEIKKNLLTFVFSHKRPYNMKEQPFSVVIVLLTCLLLCWGSKPSGCGPPAGHSHR